MPKFFSSVLLTVLLAAGCSKDQTTPYYSVTVPSGCGFDMESLKYTPTIKIIIGKNCAYIGCHYPGNANYDFTSYEVVAERIRSGRFTERMLLPVNDPLHMPQGFAMDSCELAKMMTWINNGFPGN